MSPPKGLVYYSQWLDILIQIIYYIITNIIQLLIILGNMYLAYFLDKNNFEWTNWLQVIVFIVSFNISGLVYAINYVANFVNKVSIGPIDLYVFIYLFEN